MLGRTRSNTHLTSEVGPRSPIHTLLWCIIVSVLDTASTPNSCGRLSTGAFNAPVRPLFFCSPLSLSSVLLVLPPQVPYIGSKISLLSKSQIRLAPHRPAASSCNSSAVSYKRRRGQHAVLSASDALCIPVYAAQPCIIFGVVLAHMWHAHRFPG